MHSHCAPTHLILNQLTPKAHTLCMCSCRVLPSVATPCRFHSDCLLFEEAHHVTSHHVVKSHTYKLTPFALIKSTLILPEAKSVPLLFNSQQPFKLIVHYALPSLFGVHVHKVFHNISCCDTKLANEHGKTVCCCKSAIIIICVTK